MSSLHAEVALASGYALFLLAVAGGLDLLARHSHRRSDRYRTAGFTYHAHLDAWECPEGQHLWLHGHDHERRLLRYRGKPQVCNACPRKQVCTDSDEGREIVRFLDDWPRLEAGRFHRGLSVMLVALAALIVLVALARHHDPAELAILGSLVILSAFLGGHLAPELRPDRPAVELHPAGAATRPNGVGAGRLGLRSAHEAASGLDPALARPPARPGTSETASPGGGAPGR